MSRLTDRVRLAVKAAVGIFNDNSYQQAWGLLSGTLPGAAGLPPSRGTAEYLRAYAQMPWLRAVTGRIATAVARVEWQLFVVKGKGDAKARMAKNIQRADAQHRRALLLKAEDKNELQQITEHPLLEVLHNANDFQTGYALRKVTQLHLDLVGEAFWLKERDAQGTIVGVWPIPPNWIMATPTPAFRFYRVNYRAWRGLIPDTEFLWFSEVDPLNPYGRGSGSAMSLGDELETDEYAARHTKAFFYNSARPDLLVWPKGQGLNEANVKRLEDDWVSKSQGFWKAFKPYFLTREVEVKELEQNFRSQQLVQLREFERDIVMQHFGVPPEILGVLEHSNRSTIDAADFLMARYVLEPRLEFVRTILQERFVPEFDERLIIDYVNPGTDDREQQLEAAKVSPWAPTVDEWRKLMGLPPLEDKDAGALHMVPFNVTAEHIAEAPEPPPMPPPGTPPPPPPPAGGQPGQPPAVVEPEPVPTDPGEGRRAMALDGGVLSGRGGGDALLVAAIAAAEDAADRELARGIAAAERWQVVKRIAPASVAAAKMERPLVRALVRTWTDHAARLDMRALREAVGPSGVHGDVAQLLENDGLNEAQTNVLEPALRRAMMRGADVGLEALRHAHAQRRADTKAPLEVDLAGTHVAAAEWARAHAADLAKLPADLKRQVKDLVEESISDGVTPDELARLIRDTVGLTERQAGAVAHFRERLQADGVVEAVRAARVARYAQAQRVYRAQTIARTELLGSLNHGQLELWQQAGQQGVIKLADFEKVWIVTDDDLLEEECEGMADEQVPVDEDFSGGYDAPPAHPNCRCAVGLVNAGKAARTARGRGGVEVHNHIHLPPVGRQRIERDEHGRPTAIVSETE